MNIAILNAEKCRINEHHHVSLEIIMSNGETILLGKLMKHDKFTGVISKVSVKDYTNESHILTAFEKIKKRLTIEN